MQIDRKNTSNEFSQGNMYYNIFLYIIYFLIWWISIDFYIIYYISMYNLANLLFKYYIQIDFEWIMWRHQMRDVLRRLKTLGDPITPFRKWTYSLVASCMYAIDPLRPSPQQQFIMCLNTAKGLGYIGLVARVLSLPSGPDRK